jgi:hypothetical protein
VFLLFGVLAAGCSGGGDEDDAEPASGAKTSTTLPEQRAEDPPPSGRDLAFLGREHDRSGAPVAGQAHAL